MFGQQMITDCSGFTPKDRIQSCLGMFTFKQGADLLPAGDTSLLGVLAQSRFQEEQRNATGEQEEDVRDEEDSWETVKSAA